MNFESLIDLAILEDIGDGDHTSISTIPADAIGTAKLLVKENGIIAGVEIAKTIFHKVDNTLITDIIIFDGAVVNKGNIVLTVKGKIRSILQAERLVLNFMQRMSGIATVTNTYVKAIEGTRAKILDTRKTTPGMRYYEKLAVKIGGGQNHRFGLYDMIMIKDNHVDFSGGISAAINKANEYIKLNNKKLKIEAEVRNFDEIKEVIACGGVGRVMFDNFTPEDMKKAVEMINKRFETEASGGITLSNIKEYADTGVDFISVGALTHHIKSLDLSLKAVY